LFSSSIVFVTDSPFVSRRRCHRRRDATADTDSDELTMDYDYDTADILGSNEVPIVRDGRPRWSGTAKLVGVGATLLLLALAATHVRNMYKKWQEKNYRK
jgi:hypothetical protein